MCGIAGFVDNSPNKQKIVRSMIDSITYRGPDSYGTYAPKDGGIALGIRRLSVIDLRTGDQPISNEDGSITVVFNGEIYNYAELRSELVQRGHKFKTGTDTEVLVHLYEEYGQDMPNKLNGMFAFAIWDKSKKTLFLSRDRVGIKPLYYYLNGDVFVFGSELKAILKHPNVKRQVNELALGLYWYLGYIPGEWSVFKNIRKLLPGHSLIYTKGKSKIKNYFQLQLKDSYRDVDLDILIENSVKMQLHADVPVGVFLSGGLDSSLIAHYVSKFKKLKSFSISFDDKRFDESKHAKYVADILGTDHYDERFVASDVPTIFKKVSEKLDEPLSDASLLPTFKVSELARKHVTVALSGDGGDELFGGYPTYQAHIGTKYIDYLPNNILEILSSLVMHAPTQLFNLIPTSFKDYPKKELAEIVLSGAKLPNPQRHFYWMRSFFLGKTIIFPNPDDSYLREMSPEPDSQLSTDTIGRYIDFHTYLRDDFLVKSDRASMYNSLEVRVPFLDNDVIDYAFTKGVKHVTLSDTKIQLRKLLSDKLPEIARRPKKGFGIPLGSWMKDELRDFTLSQLNNDKLYNYIEKSKIDSMASDHMSGKIDRSGALWQIIVFGGWLDNWT